MKRLKYFKLSLIASLLSINITAFAQNFIHPGILHSKADLDRMKKAVAEKQEPIYAGYKVFCENRVSQNSYKMQGPLVTVSRNPTVGQAVYDTDANAAHQNAIQWVITGDKAYADKAIEIVNSWSSTLKSITGKDAVLMAGLGPFKMVNAAEILRYTNSGWKDTDIKQTENHFKAVIYPVIKNYAPFANGNWEAAAMKTVMSIAVFCNDRAMFENALQYYINGAGDGRLGHYIINEEGQIQESGRDQGHTQLGVAMLAECAEIAWHQGLNLYGYNNNKLLKGFEYVAKFNLGNEVPFVETLDRTGKYHHKTIARQDRGPLRAIYEQVYNHYVNRMGFQAAFTQQAAEKVRPEGPGKPGADHPGYGTLYFSRSKEGNIVCNNIPAAPAGITAKATTKQVSLSWIEPIGAKSYTITRSEKAGGAYSVIAKNIKTNAFTDNMVSSGKLYYYAIKATNNKGESKASEVLSVCAGLPGLWRQADIGNISKGLTQFNGSEFTITAYGKGLDSLSDALHFVYQPLGKISEITMRYVPQLSSQFSVLGLSIREGLNADASQVSLIIDPAKTEQIEIPNWQVKFTERSKSGRSSKTLNLVTGLPESAVTWGRMTGYYWLRLSRKGNAINAFVSADGKNWSSAGTTTIAFNKPTYIGLITASGMPNSTIVKFDRVIVR